MTDSITRRLVLTFCAGVLLLPLVRVQAQPFPSKAITLVVPWPAGGSTDRHFRTLGEIAGKHLGQTIVIENKPGAGGTLGPSTVALTAQPDGYTIAQYPLGMLRYPHMQKVNWHAINDFTFIIGISGYTFGFVVKDDSPYKTFNEYIEAARKQPGKINYGSTGVGTSPHLLIEELAAAAKVELNHVPYKGNADLMQSLIGGHVMAASDATGWDKFVDGGQMRLLVTFGEERTQALAQRAHRKGSRLQRGFDLTVWIDRPEGHGSRSGKDIARRVQESARRSEARRADAATESDCVVSHRR